MSRSNRQSIEDQRQATKHPKVPTGTEGVEQVTVVFLESVQWECDGRKKGPKFFKGRSYVFDQPFAEKWIKRGKAYNKADGPPDPRDDEDDEVREDFTGISRGGASGLDDSGGKGSAQPA